jgi:HlyD family secretion protein
MAEPPDKLSIVQRLRQAQIWAVRGRPAILSNRIFWKVALAGLLVVSLGAVAAFDRGDADYRTVAVELQPVSVTITASGRVKPTRAVDLHARRAGQVETVTAEVNAHVTEGQVLAQVSSGAESARVDAAESAYSMALAQKEIRALGVEKARGSLAQALAERGVPAAHAEDLLAGLSFAAKDLRRKRDLHTRGVISSHDLEKAQSHYDAISAQIKGTKASERVVVSKIAEAQAQLQIAGAQVKEAEAAVAEKLAALREAETAEELGMVRSPMDGLLIQRAVEPGQSVSSNEDNPPLFQVVGDLRQMEIHAQVDETDIGRVREGQRVTFTVDSYPLRQFTGQILEIHRAPLLLQNVVTYRVVISATNDDLALFPGMTAVARIIVEQTGAVPTVPNAALRFRPEAAEERGLATLESAGTAAEEGGRVGHLWVQTAGGSPRRVAVRLGAANDRITQVLGEALAERDRVIVGYQDAGTGS